MQPAHESLDLGPLGVPRRVDDEVRLQRQRAAGSGKASNLVKGAY
jgi:hypothetical protein